MDDGRCKAREFDFFADSLPAQSYFGTLQKTDLIRSGQCAVRGVMPDADQQLEIRHQLQNLAIGNMRQFIMDK